MLAVTLPKGGVGKSTTAVNLAAALAASGRRVLLVDTDTQGQTAAMLGLRGTDAPAFGLADVLAGDVPPADAVATARPSTAPLLEAGGASGRLDLLAGGPALAGAAREITRRDFGAEHVLAEALAGFAAGYDLAILDTAPGWDALSANVLFFASELLAPVALDSLALEAFAAFVRRVEDVRRYRPGLALRYVLPTLYDRRIKAPGEVLGHLRTFTAADTGGKGAPGAPILLPPVRYSVRLAEAPAHGQTVFEYAPGSSGAEDYAEAARLILETPPPA